MDGLFMELLLFSHNWSFYRKLSTIKNWTNRTDACNWIPQHCEFSVCEVSSGFSFIYYIMVLLKVTQLIQLIKAFNGVWILKPSVLIFHKDTICLATISYCICNWPNIHKENSNKRKVCRSLIRFVPHYLDKEAVLAERKSCGMWLSDWTMF